MGKFHFRISLTVFVLYSAIVGFVGFWPTPIDKTMGGVLEVGFSWLYLHGIPKFIDYNFVEFSANILFFVPMGMIMGLWFKRKIVTMLLSTYVSISIEAIQELVIPQRFSTVFDIIANTFGAAVGLFIFSPLLVRFITSYEIFIAAENADDYEAGEWIDAHWPDKDDS